MNHNRISYLSLESANASNVHSCNFPKTRREISDRIFVSTNDHPTFLIHKMYMCYAIYINPTTYLNLTACLAIVI